MNLFNSTKLTAAASIIIGLFFAQGAMAQTYVITGGGTAFTANKDYETIGLENKPIQDVIDAIKDDAAGSPCTIQFGNGTTAINTDKEQITFDGGTDGTDWGLITLTGKLTSTSTVAVIRLNNGVSIDSKAELTATSAKYMIINDGIGVVTISGGKVSATSDYAIYNARTGAVTISGGTVSATSGYAVYNSSISTVTISGGTVSATSGQAVYNSSAGTVSINGGTVSATSGYAIYNSGSLNVIGIPFPETKSSTVTISGGTVSATSGYAVYNSSIGTVSISGGTVSTATGVAIYNYYIGKITVSGTAKITSANTTETQGTIYLANNGTATDTLLEITGGTVENTEIGNAVYNASTGAVIIGGGTVSATSGNAVYNIRTGTVSIIGGTVSAISGYAVYNSSTGTVSIGGGAVQATSGLAVFNNNTGTVSISGGAVSATSGDAVLNYSTGAINISGGTVSATTGRAVRNYSTGRITVSGDAEIRSENTNAEQGTIFLAKPKADNTNKRLEITGGTVENTVAGSNAVYNASTGAVILGGSPAITGRIKKFATTDNLRVENFVPSTKIYTLDFETYSDGIIAVANGADYLLNFTLVNSDFALLAKDGNLVFAAATTSTSSSSSTVATPSSSSSEVASSSSSSSDVTTSSSSSAVTDSSSSSKGITPIPLPQIAIGNIIVKTTANSIVLENLPPHAKVRIYNLQGKQVYSTINPENPSILRIGVQTKGIYVVKTTYGSKAKMQRVLVM